VTCAPALAMIAVITKQNAPLPMYQTEPKNPLKIRSDDS
jgi:hypothetical protein